MSHVDTSSPITHVSLCAGYGGIDLGLRRVLPALRTIAYAEREGFCCANLVSKAEAGLMDAAPIWTDVKTFPWSEFRDRVDILSGGYPCQPFSAAGKRLGAEDPRHLWPHISAGIALMRPAVCFFENVEGHISLGLPDVIEDLAGLGYTTTWGIFSASEVGAPHQRKRVFILAYRHGERGQLPDWWREPAEQVPVGYGETWRDVADSHSNEPSAQRGDDGEVRGLPQTQRQPEHGAAVSGGNCTLAPEVWPSRPGEQQFAWEPPRVVVDAKSQRAGQRSELRSEECGSQSALPWDVEQSGEGSVANDHSPHAGHGEQRPERTLGDLSGGRGEAGAMGNAAHTNRRSRVSAEEAGAGPEDIWRRRSGESGERQTQPSLGRDADGPADWLDDAELYTTCDNRTDELRLLGNGVVPATAERAFRVLVGELMEHQP